MIELYKYQKQGVVQIEAFIRKSGGALLADDMGLGKTLQALWVLKRSKIDQMFPALIICPASVKYSWEHTALSDMNIRAQVLEGEIPIQGHFGITPKLIIINPDILMAWLSFLLSIKIKTLILDESQYFINLIASRTKAAIELSRNIPYKMALSGTPLLNRPSELWPTLHMIQSDNFPAFFSFGRQFCKPRKKFGKWEYKGAENIPELHKLLRETCMVRRLKSEVLPDLPNKIRKVVPMELRDMEEYKKANTNFSQWLRENYSGQSVERAMRAVAVTKIGYLLRLAAKLKCRSVVDWINRFLEECPDEKLVVFAIHQKMIHVIQKHINCKHITVDGSVTGRKRLLAVTQFRRDPKIRVFIGNIRAAGTGIDGLQDVCNNMAFAELYWRPGDHTQAEDRLLRIGQESHVWINYLVAGGTIEESLCRIIQTKQKVIRGILDGGVPHDDIDVFDQLLEVLRNEQEKI